MYDIKFLGNSCRSPMAECILKNLVNKLNENSVKLECFIDSAAIETWNVGRRPDERCLSVLKENGLNTNHIGRQVSYFYLF